MTSTPLPVITELPVTDDLRNKCGITRFAKEGPATLVLVCGGGSSSNANNNDYDKNKKTTIIIFHVQKGGFFDTVEDFGKASKGKLDQQTQEAIKYCLAQGEYPELIMKNGNPSSSSTNDGNGSDGTNHRAEEAADGSDDTGVTTTAADHITVDRSKDLDPYIADRNYVEFAIMTAKKTVKQEDSLVRQILYTGLSAYTNDPINLGIIAPTSEGKTYPVIEALKPFPKEDVWVIGSMSTKLLVRQKGVLVDENNELLKPQIRELKKRIASTQEEQEKQEEIRDRLSELYENARTLIDLSGKILVFLEPPQHELWNLLKPILSHDKEEIEFPFVDRTERGLEPKRVIVKGWPACIFCSARDESSWPEWPEIKSRFLITSPNMNTAKYHESNMLIAQRKSLPSLVQQRIIVSDEEIELAKRCVLYVKQEIHRLMSTSSSSSSLTQKSEKNNPVWIPFGQILAEILPAEKGMDTRVTKRLFSLLQIMPLAKAHIRQKLILGPETLVVAALEDLNEALHITQNISGIPAYKLKFFKEIFLPLYRSKSRPDEENQEEEKRIAVTTKQLCDYFKKEKDKAITTNNLKKTYINELLNNGYIDEEDSVIDKRQKVYFPIVDLPVEKKDEEEKIRNFRNQVGVDNFLQHSKIVLPRNCTNIPESWLKLEILDLLKYPLGVGKCTLLDKDGISELCICRFASEYEKTSRLSGYFSKHEIEEYSRKIFGTVKYLGKIDPDDMKNYPLEVNSCSSFFSNDNQQVSQVSSDDISSDEKPRHTMAAATVRNNIHYSQAILLKNVVAEESKIKTCRVPDLTDIPYARSTGDDNIINGKENQVTPAVVETTLLVPIPPAASTTTTVTVDRSDMPEGDGPPGDDNNSGNQSTSIHRLGHSDIWACNSNNCKLTGDRWYMQKHLCRGSR